MGDPGARTFEIGLVMAGAISAGAYTAGVVDFLIQALDAWEEAKAGNDPDCPRHNVALRIMAGASAGGMTAAIAAGQLTQAFAPVTAPTTGAVNNKLYASWVESIDIAPLLGTRDLDAAPGDDVRSALDSTILDEIAADAFRFPAGTAPVARPYLADPLHLILTVTNLRGVPYQIPFRGDDDGLPQMMMHGDVRHFALGDGPAPDGDVIRLPRDDFGGPAWSLLGQAALATGAFPVGLAPRALSRPASDYSHRTWPIAGTAAQDGRIVGCGRIETLPTDFPDAIANDPNFQYNFLCVDGGTVDNEPLELARQVLDGDNFFNPETRGDRVDRGLIAVAPFPNLGAYPVREPTPGNPFLLHVIAQTLYSMLDQVRFQPELARRAGDPQDFSRYLIAPRRPPVPGAKVQSRIASGALGGFGGFLSRAFREHDYQLGRRNCQEFLRNVFALPDQDGDRNPLFEVGWTDAARRKYRIVEGPDGKNRPPLSEPGPGDTAYLPIIPLVDSVAAEVPVLDWPSYSASDLATLRGRAESRLNAVLRRLIDRNGPNFAERQLLNAAVLFFKGHLADKVAQNVASDLADRGLMTGG